MHTGVSTALVGFSDADQIKEAVSAAEHDPLPRAHMERLRELWGRSTP
jgi:aryl-alcohol dehydrogenase-like predicted oxidoreductase